MLHSVSNPAIMVLRIASRLGTGSTPGYPMQTGQTLVFGSQPYWFGQPQNILLSVRTWACTSRPITASYFMFSVLPRPAYFFTGSMRSNPANGRSTSGMTTVPSSSWLFSRMAISTRSVTAVALMVWTYSRVPSSFL